MYDLPDGRRAQHEGNPEDFLRRVVQDQHWGAGLGKLHQLLEDARTTADHLHVDEWVTIQVMLVAKALYYKL